MTVLLSIALYYALRGAIRQWWHDVSVEARAARVRTARRTAAFKKRHKPYHPGRVALTTGAVAAFTARGVVRTAAFTGRSLWTGAKAGWAEGKERAEARAARRAEAAEASAQADPDQEATVTDGTVRLVCPGCGEPIRRTPPTTWNPSWGDRPRYSHLDGEPLCPEGPDGYRPASPEQATPEDAPPEPAAPEDTSRPAGQQRSPSGGEAMNSPTVDSTGEAVNIAAARAALDAIVQAADQAVGTIDNLSASMQGADMDADTLGDVAAVLEAATAMHAAAAKARSGLDDRHAVMEEAVNTTPHAAKTDFYRH